MSFLLLSLMLTQAEWTWMHINNQLILEAQFCIDNGGYPVTVLGPAHSVQPLLIRCLKRKKK